MANKADVGFTNRKKCRWQSGRRAVTGIGKYSVAMFCGCIKDCLQRLGCTAVIRRDMH